MPANVLWLVMDTARRDAFEPYGAGSGATPVVADLARRGRAHEGVHAAGCWTIPSHAAMFTGLLPRAAGLCDAPDGSPFNVRPVLEAQRDRLLPEVMRRNGYATAGVTTNLWIDEKSGFATGFDDWVSVENHRQEALGGSTLRVRLGWARQALMARVDDGAAEAGRVLRGWAGERRDKPFFWFANLIECHSPYLPPKPWNPLGPVDRLRAGAEARRHLTLSEIWKCCVGGFDVPDGALERMRRLYAAAIREMDDWLGTLLEALDAAGALDDTLVIVTSDHGENFGENGLMGHALSLDERLTHVPFVAAGPGADAFDGMASLAELPRRIAAAVGLERHPWGDDELPPLPVAQFDAIVQPGDPRVRAALDEWGLGEDAGVPLVTPLTSVTDGRLKLVRRGDAEEVYDLAADPLESRPVPPSAAGGSLDALRAALEHPAATAVREPERPVDAGASDDVDKLEAQMRLLGYL